MPPKPEPDHTCHAAADGQCSGPYMGKGLCQRHYSRQYLRGTTELTTLKTAPDEVRYRASVSVQEPGDCWPWTGTVISTTGYGQLYWDSHPVSAHVAGWELATGLIAANFWVDHICHNRDMNCPGREDCLHRRCQNPMHWKAVTPGVNLARSRLTTTHQGWEARGAAEEEYEALMADPDYGRLAVALFRTRAIGTWRGPDCPRGHKLTGENLIRHPERGTIGCRTCMMRTKRFRGHRLLRQD